MRSILIIVSILSILFTSLTSTDAKTITIGAGKLYTSIQTAINAAVNGDRIEVYSNGTDNVYNEDITFNSLQNVALVGMLSNRVVKIRGNMSLSRPITIGSGTTGILLENFVLMNNSNSSDYYIYVNGSNATIKNCEINGSRDSSAGVGPIVFSGGNCNVIKCYFNVGKMYAAIETMGSCTNLTVKYCEFYGGVNYTLGAGEGGSGHNFSYNYFHTTGSEAPSWKAVRMRGITNYNVNYNLVVISGLSGWQAGINDRCWSANSGPGTISHNTVIAPKVSGTTYYSAGFGSEGGVGGNGRITVKNNIFQGGEFCGAGFWAGSSANVVFEYNYCFAPSKAPDYYHEDADKYWTISNNIETTNNTPGFLGTGIIWQTDGTDAGTVSQYYSLQTGSNAITACESGTYCGAFRISGDKPPSAPGGLRIVQ